MGTTVRKPGMSASRGMKTGLPCGRWRRNRHTRGHWHANRPVLTSPCYPGLSPHYLELFPVILRFPCYPALPPVILRFPPPPVILRFPVILSAAKDLLSPAARQRNGGKILRRLRLLRMTGRKPGMLMTGRKPGMLGATVQKPGMSRAEVGYRHVCGQRRRAWHTRGRGHGNRHTRGRRGGTRHTCKRRYRNCPSRAAAWAWICRPFRGVLSAGLSWRA